MGKPLVFFRLLQRMYVFFAASAHRWAVLQAHLKQNAAAVMPKQVSDRWWSAEADAMRAFVAGSKEIKATSMKLVLEGVDDEWSETKQKANSLLKVVTTLETTLMAEFWDRVSQDLNATSKAPQSPALSLNADISPMKLLCEYISGLRERPNKNWKACKGSVRQFLFKQPEKVKTIDTKWQHWRHEHARASKSFS